MKFSIKVTVTVEGIVIYILDEGKVLGTFVHFTPRVNLASAPVCNMSLTHVERPLAVAYVLKSKLVRLLSLGEDHQFVPQRNLRACKQMMLCMTRRVAAGLAAMRDIAAKKAEELCELGYCAAAIVPLQRAIDLGDLPSRALMAWLLIDGREGVTQDRNRAFQLVDEGDRLGCYHCQGVMAYCYYQGYGIRRDYARSFELAYESSEKSSRYGLYVLSELYRWGLGGIARDYAQAVTFLRMAAAQNLDEAQCRLGRMIDNSRGVALDFVEALRLYQLAAAQGHPYAMFNVAVYHELGRGGVCQNKAEAIRWYRRALVAGYFLSKFSLKRLCA